MFLAAVYSELCYNCITHTMLPTKNVHPDVINLFMKMHTTPHLKVHSEMVVNNYTTTSITIFKKLHQFIFAWYHKLESVLENGS